MDIISGLVSVVILIYSAILHEVAHGIVAERLGDPTARLLGRITLNPKNHIDPFMSVLLPLVLILGGSPIVFGAAKPVPVDPFNLRDGRKDMALVSLAGPLTNFLVAVIAALIAKTLVFITPVLGATPDITGIIVPLYMFLFLVVKINLILAIFNLIPIPPLDGSKVFSLLLPEKEASTFLAIGNIGIFVIFFLLMFPIGGFSLGAFIGSLLTFALKLLGL
jgi:Zn-dependent protease